ncbi:MAG: hypothetical protein ACTSQW_05915 [Promethearchaeota archaeon]
MNEVEKKKRLKGFAKIVAREVEVLNTIEQFKEDFKDSLIKILLNAKDGKYAALLVIALGWDGLLQTKTEVFVELLGGGDISMGSIIWKVITFRIKIKGIKNLLLLMKLFEYDE